MLPLAGSSSTGLVPRLGQPTPYQKASPEPSTSRVSSRQKGGVEGEWEGQGGVGGGGGAAEEERR